MKLSISRYDPERDKVPAASNLKCNTTACKV